MGALALFGSDDDPNRDVGIERPVALDDRSMIGEDIDVPGVVDE